MSAALKIILISILGIPVLAAAEQQKRFVFLGDSITAGFGLEITQAYPALIEEKLRVAGFSVKVVNAGVSGDTTSGGLSRFSWVSKEPIDYLFIALGANDGLRGIPTDVSGKNLKALVERARQMHPGIQIVIAGMALPLNYGDEYTKEFQAMFERVSKEIKVEFYPFLLEGVALDSKLNLPDGIHPNEKGQKVIADNVWKFLSQTLFKS